jgi:hypothetical protein
MAQPKTLTAFDVLQCMITDMLFVEWWLVRRFCFGLLIAIGAIVVVWATRAKSWRLRLPILLLSLPTAIAGALFALLTWNAAGCQSYSSPLYSPNGRMAVRIRISDEGALGGSTSVELFSAHGFNTSEVFQGASLTVKPEDVHWKNDSELEIRYDGEIYSCSNAGIVKVHCAGKK